MFAGNLMIGSQSMVLSLWLCHYHSVPVFSSLCLLSGHLLIGGQSMVSAITESLASLPLIQKQRSSPAREQLPPVQLSPLQEERLKRLQERMSVAFDLNNSEHEVSFFCLFLGKGGGGFEL